MNFPAMSEPAEVCLVRCPECENLLPELTDFSVYRCSGCDAVVRANDRNVEADTSSEKSDEERVGGFSDKSEKNNRSNNSFSCKAESKEVLSDIAAKYKNCLKIKTDEWVVDNDLDTSKSLDQFNYASKGKAFEQLRPQNGIADGSRRLGQNSDWRIRERGEMEGFRTNPRMEVEGMRDSSSNYSKEGPSNYHFGSSYGYGESVKNQNEADGFNKVQYLEQDRAELLRKIDELKDQLSRSCDVNDKPKEKVPHVPRMAQQDPYGGVSESWFPDGSLRSSRTSVQYSMPDRHVARAPYISNYPEPAPFSNRHEMAIRNFYLSMHTSNQVQDIEDPVRSQMLRRATHQAPGPSQQLPHHMYYSQHDIDNDMDLFEPYPHNVNLHPLSCSCFHCYRKHRHVSAPVPPTGFYNNMLLDFPNNPMLYHHENPGAFVPLDYNTRIAKTLPLNSHNPQSHARWTSDLNSEAGGLERHYPSREVMATGGRRCRPIAGGAPFVTCFNCFELLQLPKKFFLMDKDQNKMQCGACSTIILFAVINKKLVSVHEEAKKTLTEVDDGPIVAVNGGASRSHSHANQASITFSSDDYDNSGYDFLSMDRVPSSLSTDQGLSSSKPEEIFSLHSVSSYNSENKDTPDSLMDAGQKASSTEMPVKPKLSPPLPGSSLQELFDYSTKFRVVNQFGEGNQSGRSDPENMMLKKFTSLRNSMKDASSETEMEVSFEYSNTGVSQNSEDTFTEEDQLRVNKGAESFFAGIREERRRGFSTANQNVDQGNTNVTVNGHPIPDQLVKKAEKLAGPVHPGQYWYDFRAGFWGVMGGPCRGIIPPFIEEFNYPMPANCSGGNTGTYVNGRELHERDMGLLSSRGLPTARDRSYIIEISGRVLDEESGEELDSLGKLAPTVEKLKRGFGMKIPRAAA